MKTLNIPILLQTERLFLKSISDSSEDDSNVLGLFNDSETVIYLRNWGPWTLERVAKRRLAILEQQQRNESCNFNIFLKDQTFVGVGGFRQIQLNDPQEPRNWGEIGCIIDAKYQRMGFATEMYYHLINFGFGTLKLDLIRFHTTMDNIPQRAWLERICKLKHEHSVIVDQVEFIVYFLTLSRWIPVQNSIAEKIQNSFNLS
jgi:RimJ/RimL family protein N-acetyltransferase